MNQRITTSHLAVGVLSITAVILLSALLILQAAPNQAMAIGQNGSGGDLVVTTSQLDDTAELIYVLDANLQRLNIYGYNVEVAQIELIQQIDLAPLQRPAQPQGGAERRR